MGLCQWWHFGEASTHEWEHWTIAWFVETIQWFLEEIQTTCVTSSGKRLQHFDANEIKTPPMDCKICDQVDHSISKDHIQYGHDLRSRAFKTPGQTRARHSLHGHYAYCLQMHKLSCATRDKIVSTIVRSDQYEQLIVTTTAYVSSIGTSTV